MCDYVNYFISIVIFLKCVIPFERRLPWEKDGYLLDLTENKQAKIQFNNAHFTIQYDGIEKSNDIKIAYWKLSRRLYRRLSTDLLFKSILIALFVFGGFLGWFRKKIITMEAIDSRFFIIPLLLMSCMFAVNTDTENLAFNLLKVGMLPFIVIFFASVKTKYSRDLIEF